MMTAAAAICLRAVAGVHAQLGHVIGVDDDHFERQSAYAQQRDLGVRQVPDTAQVALAALRADMSARRVASLNA